MTESDPQVIQTLYEMLQQRGYTVDINEDDEQFTATKPDGEQVVIFSNIAEKYDVNSFRATVATMNELNIKHGIIVYSSITPATKTKISSTEAIQLTIERFEANQLRINPTKHHLVPLHEKLSRSESKEFKKQYGTNIKIIKSDDVISRFYAFRKGDIIKITRNTGYIDYRVVK